MSYSKIVDKEALLNALESGKKIIVFGASSGAEYLFCQFLDGMENKISYFVDNDVRKWGKMFLGAQVHSPEMLYHEDKEKIFILISASQKFCESIIVQLIRMGFEGCFCASSVFTDSKISLWHRNVLSMREEASDAEPHIEKLMNILEDKESKRVVSRIIEKRKNQFSYYYDIYSTGIYFDRHLFPASPCGEGVYLDCGVHDHNTILQFMRFCDYKYKKIYGFEPALSCANKTWQYFSNTECRVEILPLAVGNQNGCVSFLYREDNTSGSRVCESAKANMSTYMITLDSFIKNENVTFIKMDIEGGEIAALRGAENLIKTLKPKLAISIYHKPEDLWEIPFLIKQMVPEYKLYIRHHTWLRTETVLYATL